MAHAGGLTGEGDLLAAETRLITNHGAGAALALHAVAHRDARWFALDGKAKPPAASCGASAGHWQSPGSAFVAGAQLGRRYCSRWNPEFLSCRKVIARQRGNPALSEPTNIIVSVGVNAGGVLAGKMPSLLSVPRHRRGGPDPA